MICYKDKTFCPFWEECEHGTTCTKALTSKVLKDANTWWEEFKSSNPAPIAVFTDKPVCFEDIVK